MGVLTFLKDSVFAEEYCLKKGLLQQVDPRLKVFSFVLLFITLVLLRRIELLILLYLFCFLLAISSGINPVYFVKRSAIFIPLFSLFIAIPAFFSFLSAGQPLFAINIIFTKLVITKEGLHAGLTFVLRVFVSVSCAVLLSLTTANTQILKALRYFKVPQVFVLTAGMCYRYIYLFIKIVEDTYLSIRSRSAGILHYKKGQRVVAWSIGNLWQRSYYLSEQVYSAMLARGYRGEPAVMDSDAPPKLLDWIYLAGVVSVIVYMLWLNTKL